MSYTFERHTNHALTNLSVGISDSDTSLILDDPINFPTSAPFRIIIGDEIMRVTNRAGAVFTVVRGQEGTTAESHASGETCVHVVTVASFLSAFEINGVADVRLSFSANDPNAREGSGGTLYAVPYNGNKIGLLDPIDAHWRINEVGSGVPVGLTGQPSGTMCDVFMYHDVTTQAPKLELTAWTNTTTRTGSGELTTRDGVTVRFDDPTRRYLGTVYCHEANYSISNPRRRFLWNKNSVEQELYQTHGFTSYTYATNSVRNVNNSADERVEYVVGQSGEAHVKLTGTIAVNATVGGTNQYVVGFGINTTSSMNGKTIGAGWGLNSTVQISAIHQDRPAQGLHYAQLLERNASSQTATVYGTNGTTYQDGVLGTIQG